MVGLYLLISNNWIRPILQFDAIIDPVLIAYIIYVYCVMSLIYYVFSGRNPSPMWDKLVFNKIKARLGGRVRLMTSGASPLSADVMEFLRMWADFFWDLMDNYLDLGFAKYNYCLNFLDASVVKFLKAMEWQRHLVSYLQWILVINQLVMLDPQFHLVVSLVFWFQAFQGYKYKYIINLLPPFPKHVWVTLLH